MRVLDQAGGGLNPAEPATRRLRGPEQAGGRRPLAVVCQERYRRQRLARGRVMLSLPDRGSDAVTSLQLGALAALSHPDILPVQDWQIDGGIPYIVSPPPPDDSLSAALVEGRVRRSGAIELLAVIARAVDFAHEQGVVHGCLEPAAIMLDREGHPLVADFGLASLVAAAPPPSGVCYFDSAFVAPERMLGQEADRASDVYAFAAIAYELLTGEAPFAGVANTADQVYALVNSDPVRPSGLDRAIPDAVDEVVMSGLARDQAWRWRSCTAMLQALELSFEAPPQPAAPPPSLAAAPEFTFPIEEVPVTPEPPAEVTPRWSPRQRVGVGRPFRGAYRRAPRNSHWFAKTLAVAILCALSAVGGAMLVPTGQPGEQDLFGLPSIRHYLPAAVAQRIPTQPRTGTAVPTPGASPPATLAKTPPPGGTTSTSAPAQKTPAPAAAPGFGITVSSARANPGGVVTVTGTGFNASQKFSVHLAQVGTDYEIQPATQVPASGIFSVPVTIPSGVTPGAATIKACNVDSNGVAVTCAQQQITVA